MNNLTDSPQEYQTSFHMMRVQAAEEKLEKLQHTAQIDKLILLIVEIMMCMSRHNGQEAYQTKKELTEELHKNVKTQCETYDMTGTRKVLYIGSFSQIAGACFGIFGATTGTSLAANLASPMGMMGQGLAAGAQARKEPVEGDRVGGQHTIQENQRFRDEMMEIKRKYAQDLDAILDTFKRMMESQNRAKLSVASA